MQVRTSRKSAPKPLSAFIGPQAASLFAAAVACLRLWAARRRDRRELRRLDERLLRDIGTNGYDAAREARKPFWRE